MITILATTVYDILNGPIDTGQLLCMYDTSSDFIDIDKINSCAYKYLSIAV